MTGPRAMLPTALAVGVPLACFFATASGHAHWLDSGEFVAQAVDFGISHPPGHPLAGIVSGAFAWLVPLGPIGFRLAIANGLLVSLATYFVFVAAARTLAALGLHVRLVMPLSVGVAWVVAGSYGWWFQAVRPEVYALQAALLCFALERLTRVESALPQIETRPLYEASLALGLAMANHHFLAFLMLPVGAATLARVVRERGAKTLGRSMLLALLGASTYVYLPLRAMSDAFLRLGEPTTADRLYWVVSAQAFQKNQGDGVPQSLVERLLDVLAQLALDLGPLTLVAALGGFYLLMRGPLSRRLALVWGLLVTVFVGARSWLGFVRSNPDALGYLMPAAAAIVVLSAALIAILLRAIAGPKPERPRFVALVLAWGVGAASLLQLVSTGPKANQSAFADTDVIDDALRRELPPRAVLLAYGPQTCFRFWGGESEEGLRPDVTLVPMPFLTYPGLVESLAAEAPELRELLRHYRLNGELGLPQLQTLASERPVLIELDLRYPEELYDTLSPRGIFHQVVPDGTTAEDRREGARAQQERWHVLQARMGGVDDDETRNKLLMWHYNGALFHAALGDRDAAIAATDFARKLNPHEEVLNELRAALDERDEDGDRLSGPLDIGPFRVDAEPDP